MINLDNFLQSIFFLLPTIYLGVDLSANQNEITKDETFQMEFDNEMDCWYLSTRDGRYWSPGAASTIQIDQSFNKSNKTSDRGGFRLVWNKDDGTCSLNSIDRDQKQSRPLCARKSGQLYTANGSEPIKFYMKFLNRTNISLRALNSSGFVGIKGQGIENRLIN